MIERRHPALGPPAALWQSESQPQHWTVSSSARTAVSRHPGQSEPGPAQQQGEEGGKGQSD